MNALRPVAVSVLALLVCTNDALAWGHDGHETIGYIAAQTIANTRAEAEVAKILREGETLASAAEWPDCAKGFRYCNAAPTPEMKQFARSNPAHHAYHYTDVPIQRLKYTPTSAGAGPNDVVHALQDAIRVLQGRPPADPGHVFTQRTALFVVAHAAGDIHQPLHVGAAYVGPGLKLVNPRTAADVSRMATEGGNWLCVGSKGLHSDWDGVFVQKTMKLPQYQAAGDQQFAANLLSSKLPTMVPDDDGDPQDWPAKWASESLKLSKAVLAKVRVSGRREQDKNGGCGKPDGAAPHKVAWTVVLPTDYQRTAVETVVPQQLVRAGTRLGRLLMAIWPDPQPQ